MGSDYIPVSRKIGQREIEYVMNSKEMEFICLVICSLVLYPLEKER